MKKKIVCLSMVVCLMILSSMSVSAYGRAFNFTVHKNQGVQRTGIVYKEDNEACSYVTVQNVMWSTQDPWVFGARVRQSNGLALTDYYTTRYIGAMGYPGMPFLSGVSAYAGQPCQLNAQVDSSSAATIITADGVWLP